MKLLRYFLLGLGILFVLYLPLCLLADPRIDAETSLVLPHPPASIYPLIADLRQRERWNPYDDEDTTVRYRYGAITLGVGAEYSWTSQSGPGAIRIETAIPNSLVRETLTFEDYGSENTVEFLLDSLPEGTKVTWHIKGKSDFPFLFRGLMGLWINSELDGYQREGLRQLGEAAGKFNDLGEKK